jgi:hypothetical protein
VHRETLWMGDAPKSDSRLSQLLLSLHWNPSQGWLSQDFHGCPSVRESCYGFNDGWAFDV